MVLIASLAQGSFRVQPTRTALDHFAQAGKTNTWRRAYKLHLHFFGPYWYDALMSRRLDLQT